MYHISHLFCTPGTKTNFFTSKEEKTSQKSNLFLKLSVFPWLNFFSIHLFVKIMVFCYQNCSDLLWEKIVLVIEKNFWNSRLKAENLQNFWDQIWWLKFLQIFLVLVPFCPAGRDGTGCQNPGPFRPVARFWAYPVVPLSRGKKNPVPLESLNGNLLLLAILIQLLFA